RQYSAASRRAGYLDGINDAARAVAAGDSPSALIDRIAAGLCQLLALRSCEFQHGIAGIGRPARLESDGQVTVAGRPYDLDYGEWPPTAGLKLRVESGGRLQGRFLMQPGPGRPTREQLLVAIALADQAGAGLAASYPA